MGRGAEVNEEEKEEMIERGQARRRPEGRTQTRKGKARHNTSPLSTQGMVLHGTGNQHIARRAPNGVQES